MAGSTQIAERAGAGVHEAAAGGQGGVLEAIGSGWEHLENRHLRQLLRVFLSPFILKYALWNPAP